MTAIGSIREKGDLHPIFARHYAMVTAAPAGVENGTDRAGTTIISNQLPGLDFGLGNTADMIRSSVERLARAEIVPRA